MRSEINADRALKEIIAYRDGLDKRNDKALVSALNRVIDVVQNHLYHAYLEVRDFYETTLLSTTVPVNVKADMALDIAERWEHMDQSSSAVSTSHIPSGCVGAELASGVRCRSLSHIIRPATLEFDVNKTSVTEERNLARADPFDRSDLSRSRRHHRHRQHHQSGKQQHSHRLNEPLFDDNTEGSSQSPSFGCASVVSNSTSSRSRSCLSSPFRVQLTRGPHGFGFSIAGGTDQEPTSPIVDPRFVYVARITPGGVADLDGRLRVNDILLSVNGLGLVSLPHLKAVTVFEQSGSHLDLVVQRPSSILGQGVSSPAHSMTPPPAAPTAGRGLRGTRGDRPEARGAPPRSRLMGLSRSHCIVLPASSNSPSSSDSSDPPPTTVSPLSSLFTSCHQPFNSAAAREQAVNACATAATTAIGEEAKNAKRSGGIVNEEDEDDTVWLFDPEQTASGQSVSRTSHVMDERESHRIPMSSAKLSPVVANNTFPKSPPLGTSAKSYPHLKDPPFPVQIGQWELSSRPKPDPSPGPVLVEVPLVRGTSNGFGFSIAGGVGTEFLEGDSGIFIIQVTAGGVADTTGRIGVGDRLVRVNNVSLVDVTHAKAVEVLNTAGDFAVLLLVKASLQSSPRRVNCQRCQDTLRSLPSSSTASATNEGKITDGRASRASAEGFGGRREAHQRKAGRRRLMTPQCQPVIYGSSKQTAEALPLSGSSNGSEDYAAANVVSEAILKRWPRARLVTLHKEAGSMAGSHVGERLGGSLGFNIVGGDGTEGIYVSHIHPDSPAARSKAISIGDRLLVVNGIEVVGSSHEEAAILLKTAPSRVDLVLAYAPTEYRKLEDRVLAQSEVRSAEGNGHGGVRNTNDIQLGPHHSIEADGLFVRVLADFDPAEVVESNQVIPRSAIPIQSGDILQLINIADREWWQARIIHPSTCKPLGPVGLVPSRRRLERRECGKWNVRLGLETCPPRASSSENGLSAISDLQSTDRAAESIALSQSDNPSSSSRPFSVPEVLVGGKSKHHHPKDSSSMTKQGCSRRARSESASEILPPTYIPVTSMQIANARPVVILGDLKHNISEDLLSDFPDEFDTCVPHTTRQRRHGEVDGRDYHFVKTRSRMESEIKLNRYVEAGEYNGNLYGTHLHSVFKVASAGFHCLLDVGATALERLTAAGLPPITVFVLSDLPDQTLRVVDPSTAASKKETSSPHRRSRRYEKNFAFLKEYSSLLVAILSVDDYDRGMARIRRTIHDNRGPHVWVASDNFLP